MADQQRLARWLRRRIGDADTRQSVHYVWGMIHDAWRARTITWQQRNALNDEAYLRCMYLPGARRR
jgi:hypothetical protein